MKKVLIVLLLLGLLGGSYVYFFVLNKEHPDFEQLDADFSISAKELYQSFVNDPANASTKYNGKMLQLSGTVSEIERVDSLLIAVYVFNEGMFGNEGIRCTFLNNEPSLNGANDLVNYEIKGFCSGYNETDVILEKCSLVKK